MHVMKRWILVVNYILLLIAINYQLIHGLCPNSWSSYEGSCYKFNLEYITWHNAKHRCTVENAALVTISTAEENDFIRDLGGMSCQTAWIGLNDINVENTWQWLTNEPITFSNWKPGEPNSNAEDCVEMQCNLIKAWNDQECDDRNPAYVCEKEEMTVTTAIATTLKQTEERSHQYTVRLSSATARKNKCLTIEELVVLSLGRQLTISRIRCFQFCLSTANCTSFQILQTTDDTLCHALRHPDDDAQYELEPLNCGLFERV